MGPLLCREIIGTVAKGREFQERGERHSGCQATPWTLPAVLAFAMPPAQTPTLGRDGNHQNVELEAPCSQLVTSCHLCHLLLCFQNTRVRPESVWPADGPEAAMVGGGAEARTLRTESCPLRRSSRQGLPQPSAQSQSRSSPA